MNYYLFYLTFFLAVFFFLYFCFFYIFFFFFQAEDGIRDGTVTGVQTCALPILRPLPYADPARLVTLWETNHAKSLEHEPISPVNFLDYRALSASFVDAAAWWRSEEHTSELQSQFHLVCRLLLEKKKKKLTHNK